MHKWVHTIGTLTLAVLGAGSPAVQDLAGKHPTITVIGVAAWTILGNLLPPPWNFIARMLDK